ncbi:MAG: nucleotidyl transferase AbiEii/AbiGii toxin family protein [Acidobacteriota bacterium]|jgi:predicted nucleotidyltransferase component of viral defense system|nr:nucleotidyl transferase AbiEii/AbiGii toxin family protein [Acidobacteriota bacterium]
MKEQALALARQAQDPGAALNVLREYIQACVLRSLHESEAFASLAFVGGMALRFLHNIPRFSEDLDFSLVSAAGYDGKAYLAKIKRDLAIAGFDTEVTWNEKTAVHKAWIRIAGILHDAALSGHPSQRLSIKLEVDTRPPAGSRCETTVVTRHLTFLMRHYDMPSLFAGKVHALICRAYPKGRDWYDLVWHRSQVPPTEPNLPFLQNALDQTHPQAGYHAAQWPRLVLDSLDRHAAAAIAADARPFLERPQDTALLTPENIAALLGRADLR